MTRVLATALGIGLLVVAGCSNSENVVRPDPYALSERNLRTMAARIAEPAADSTAEARRAQYAARQMREAGLMPAFASSFFEFFDADGGGPEDPARAHILGYVPGRNPRYAGDLVIAAANLDSPGAAAVLETARRLALEALDTQVPERTLLVALWGPPRTGSVGVADFLDHPIWALEGIQRVVLLTADTSGATRSQTMLEELGIGSDIMSIPDNIGSEVPSSSEKGATPLTSFAEELYTHTRALTLVSDSLSHSAESR